MEHICIEAYQYYEEAEILALYRSVGWSVFANDPQVLRYAFENSLCILAAYDGNRLVGLVRAVGDGITVVFVQDVLVIPAYQGRGIGKMLLWQLCRRYRLARQIHVLTDDIPQTVGFYQAAGFTPVEQLYFRALTRVRF